MEKAVREHGRMLAALDLATQVEAGKLTPAAIVDMRASAIAEREGEIGAFVALDLEGARRTAAQSGTALAAQPLRGLPVGMKDIIDTADFPTEYGSPIYAGHRPRADASIVSLTRRAGGIVLGKTATTEFAFLKPAATKNPRNLRHTPGGSSAGSAAAVAAGMLPIAIGSQTGGSTIRPAAYCGVVGYKPSFRLLPTVGVKCVSWHLDTLGLFAARVCDAAFAAAVISGYDLRVDRGTAAPPRIALARTHLWAEASADMKRAVETTAAAAADAGARVEELVLPPIFEDALRAQSTIQDYECYRALAFEYDRHNGEISAVLRQALAGGAAITLEAYDAARRIAKRARRALADLMAETDVILTPSAPGAAPEGFGSTGSPMFNRLWTLMGSPCVNIPGLTDAAGLPLGVQLVGRFGRDRIALDAALFVEAALSAAKNTK